eukprot:13711844-Alexandrium_andersonii.AAC.1
MCIRDSLYAPPGPRPPPAGLLRRERAGSGQLRRRRGHFLLGNGQSPRGPIRDRRLLVRLLSVR